MNNNFYNRNERLIKKAVNGDSKAQFQIYELYYKAMFNTALRIVKNITEAEDIMQDAFLAAFLNIKTYKAEVSFGAWLKKIVINKALDFMKKKKLELSELNENEKFFEVENEHDTDSGSYSIEEIKNAIMELPDGYRIVLSLYLLEGYDHDEIAEILNIKASASRSQYSRARKKLFEKLKPK